MTIKLLTEQHLEFLSLKGGCTGSSESIHVKMPYCGISNVTAHIHYFIIFLTSYCDKQSSGIFLALIDERPLNWANGRKNISKFFTLNGPFEMKKKGMPLRNFYRLKNQ